MKTTPKYYEIRLLLTGNEMNRLFDATNKSVIGEKLSCAELNAVSEFTLSLLSHLETLNIRGYVAGQV